MRFRLASCIMRTTIDIDDPILREVKKLQKSERKPLGRIVSDLLARALAEKPPKEDSVAAFQWICRPMGPLIDLEDKDALYAALDREVSLEDPEPGDELRG